MTKMRAIAARAPAAMSDAAPICGIILAGGLARRMGGGDKPLKTIARQGNSRACDRAAGAAMRAPRTECQRRSRAFRSIRAAGRRRRCAGFRRTAGRHFGRARLGGCEHARRASRDQRRGRHAVHSARSRRPARKRATSAILRRSRLLPRAGVRIRSSRFGRSRSARRCAARWSRKASARSTASPRAIGSRT